MHRLSRIGIIAGIGLFAIAGMVGWQIWQGHRLALEYAQMVQNRVAATSPQSAAAVKGGTSPAGTDPAGPASPVSAAAAGPNPAAAPSPNSTAPEHPLTQPPAANASTPASYKALLADTYAQAVSTMETVKANTLALKDLKLSLASYRSKILAAKATFAADLAFVQANPPSDQVSMAPYQDFVAGLTLAYQAMDVVLSGIESLDASRLYAAREIGRTARDKLAGAYAKLR